MADAPHQCYDVDVNPQNPWAPFSILAQYPSCSKITTPIAGETSHTALCMLPAGILTELARCPNFHLHTQQHIWHFQQHAGVEIT
jgi:hypothetical protein